MTFMATRPLAALRAAVGACMMLTALALLVVVNPGAARAQDEGPAVVLSATVSEDGATCPGVERLTRSQDDEVVFCYTVTNNSDVEIPAAVITDANPSGGGSFTAKAFGRGNGGALRPGDVATTKSTPIQLGTTGRVTHSPSITVNGVVISDDIMFSVNAPIVFISDMLVKTSNREPARPGEDVTFSYTLRNDAGEQLTEPRITDSVCTDIRLVGGDTDGDGILDVDEQFQYRCTTQLDATVETASTGGGMDSQGNLVLTTSRLTVTVEGERVEGSDDDPDDPDDSEVVDGPVTTQPDTSTETLPLSEGESGVLDPLVTTTTAFQVGNNPPMTLPRTGVTTGDTVGFSLALILLGAGFMLVASSAPIADRSRLS